MIEPYTYYVYFLNWQMTWPVDWHPRIIDNQVTN